MKGSVFYKWIAGSQNDFTRQFQNKEKVFEQAKDFWNSELEFAMALVFFISLILGAFAAYYYYKPFNNSPGRHYHWKYWMLGMFFTFIGTLVVTCVVQCGLAAPKLNGAVLVEFKVAIGSAMYAVGSYFINSVIWCNCGRTNAYRLLKF